MYRRTSDGIAVPASLRMNDGAVLIGTINCGMSGRLDGLLASDVSFIEFVSKEGQQRFIAHHQIASIEPLASISDPVMPPIHEDINAFHVLGLTIEDSVEKAMESFQEKLKLYNPERWTGPDIPFEFGRYAVQKTRQINAALTVVKAAIQQRKDDQQRLRAQKPLFGAQRAAG